MTHQLIKRGPKDYYCEVCHQSWQSPTKAYCPRVPVIAYKDKGPLMSKTEMDKRGYKTDRLPASTCCFRMDGKDVQYIKLYDPSLCPRKKEVKHRLVHYVDHLLWPKRWLPFLGALVEWRQDHLQNQTLEERNEWGDLCMTVARQTSCLLAFSDNELAALGETVTFTFDLMPIRMRWERRRPDLQQRDDLIEVLLKGYHRWWWQNRSPEEIAAHEAVWAERTARDRQFEARERAAVREALFPIAPRVTWDEHLQPPVQKSLFNESEI